MSQVILKPDSAFDVGKIVCVGQNYIKHITEMKSKKTKDPVLFLKPSTSILNEGNPIVLPSISNEIHHEVELALLVGKTAKNISANNWESFIVGAGIALDLTLRDLQKTARENGLPWSVAKGFDGACPISIFTSLDQIKDIQNLQIELYVNKKLRQKSSTKNMIFYIGILLEYISKIFTLEPGDVILTGTPEGVAAISSGDELHAKISEIGEMQFKVT